MSQISAVLNDSSCQVVSSTVPDTAGLRFSQPVPRGLVHRSSVAEVFITDGARREGSGVAVAAQWPRDHALYHPDHGGLSDPLLFAETLRQAHFYTAHTYFEVPLDHHFIGRQLQFEITDPAALRVGDAPLKVVLEGEWTWVADHPTLVSRRADARLDVQLVVNGTACGRGMARGLLVNDRLSLIHI